MPDIHLGLLTGNLEGSVRIKLEPFGLNKFFPSGAFGSDHEDRNKLLPIAINRFRPRGGKEFSYELKQAGTNLVFETLEDTEYFIELLT